MSDELERGDRPVGAVTVPEAARMCRLFVDGLTIEAIAEQCGRSVVAVRDTIDKFESAEPAALELLKASTVPAVEAWRKSLSVAADKGDHRPSRDLLLHTGTIQSLDDGRGDNGRYGVQVVIGMPGFPAGPDPFDGRQVIEASAIAADNNDPQAD